MSGQQETGVIAIAASPISPVASSPSLPRDIADAKSGPGVERPLPALLHHDVSYDDPGMGQNTVPATPCFQIQPSQVSDRKSGSGASQPTIHSPIFQQQTVPLPEEYPHTVPIPQPHRSPTSFFQQETIPLEEEYELTVPIPQPYQRQTVPIPEEYDQSIAIPERYHPGESALVSDSYEQQPAPRYEQHAQPVPEQPLVLAQIPNPSTSTSDLSSPSSAEKPPFAYKDDDDLDENGFTSDERREHDRSIKHLKALRWVLYSRWLVRGISVFVSLISFILIIITVVLFLRSRHSTTPQLVQDAWGRYDNVDIRPSAAFASIGGIFTVLSLAVNIGCCFSKKVRHITPLSNAIFATISVVGISSWLSGCFYLHHNSSGRNLWYYVCVAAQAYHEAEKSESANPARMLFRRDPPTQDSKGLQFLTMCSYTDKAWDLGILQACFEIITLLNVIIAVLIVRGKWFRMMLTRAR